MLLIFMTQTFSNAIIVTDYYINTASFAATCENKDKPQLHCNGQCQMVKQLEKEDNQVGRMVLNPASCCAVTT